MTDIITGLGEYRTRDGNLKKIVSEGGGVWESYCGGLFFSNGRSLDSNKWPDIVGPWVEYDTAKDANDCHIKTDERQGFEPFWMVIGKAATMGWERKQGSFSEAAGEATRLASENPGVTFYVLKAINEYTASVTVNIKEARDE